MDRPLSVPQEGSYNEGEIILSHAFEGWVCGHSDGRCAKANFYEAPHTVELFFSPSPTSPASVILSGLVHMLPSLMIEP